MIQIMPLDYMPRIQHGHHPFEMHTTDQLRFHQAVLPSSFISTAGRI